MSEPVNNIQFFSFGSVNNKTDKTYENLLNKNIWLVIAQCGRNNEYTIIENSENKIEIFHTEKFNELIDSFIINLLPAIFNVEDTKNLIINSFNNVDEINFRKNKFSNFIADYDELVGNHIPCIFLISDFIDKLQGAFCNTEYIEISFEVEKFLSLYDLYKAMIPGSKKVYGTLI
jgi:hypothetical protein